MTAPAEATLFQKPTGTWYDDVNRVVYEWFTSSTGDGTFEIKVTRVYDGGSSVKLILKPHEALALHLILAADAARKAIFPASENPPELAREEQVRVEWGKQASEGDQYVGETMRACSNCGYMNRHGNQHCYNCGRVIPR